jgi:hypothetical protein
MFCSSSITTHLLRGIAALALLASAILLAEVAIHLRIGAFLGALILMRGCPMCWAVGLLETLDRSQRPQAQRNIP